MHSRRHDILLAVNGLVKYEKLKERVKALGTVVVAYSGGVDSTFLLRVCLDVLGRTNVLAFIGRSPSFPAEELEAAESLARSFGAEHVVEDTSEMANPDFTSNPLNRCYHCKTGLFDMAWKVAGQRGFSHVAEGSNYDDLSDFRPGRQACREKGIASPLLESELTKAEIRELSKGLGLPTWDKPAYACLASRIPYGTPIDRELLGRIGEAERIVRSMGFSHVRVRYHGDVARIELPRAMFETVLAVADPIVRALKDLGFTYVALDLQGYRTGSMNEGHL